MILLQRLARQFRSARTWIGLGILAPLGMLLICGQMLLDMRSDAWGNRTKRAPTIGHERIGMLRVV